MNRLKRTQRAAAKVRAGRHRKPAPEQQRQSQVAWPQARSSFAGLLADPTMHTAEVPPELAGPDYEFAPVDLPDVRPLVSPEQLRAALEDDDPDQTEVLPRVGVVVDETPQPAAHDGLEPVTAPWIPEPVPVPSTPFLNVPAEPEPPRPRMSTRMFATFDNGFWSMVSARMRRAHSVADVLAADNDTVALALDAHLDRIERMVRGEKPLPRRTPGAALKAIESARGELAVAR